MILILKVCSPIMVNFQLPRIVTIADWARENSLEEVMSRVEMIALMEAAQIADERERAQSD